MVHRRLVLIASSFVLVATAACRERAPEPDQNAAAPAPAREAKPSAAIPVPKPAIGREQLIIEALHALSAAALGQDDSVAQKRLNGRRFELRLRFGCPGEPASGSRNWSYDADEHVLRVQVRADVDSGSVPASDLLMKGYEGAIGFVIDKPLLLSAGCPSPQFAAQTTVEPTIAVAQMFTGEDSRVQRPQQSYEVTKKIDDAQKPAQGLDLVIAGRLAALTDDRPIHCAFAQGPPACIVAAKFDRVSIENPVDGSLLGEWSQW